MLADKRAPRGGAAAPAERPIDGTPAYKYQLKRPGALYFRTEKAAVVGAAGDISDTFPPFPSPLYSDKLTSAGGVGVSSLGHA